MERGSVGAFENPPSKPTGPTVRCAFTMNILALWKLALCCVGMIYATANASALVASTEDVINAIESIGLQGNRTIAEMVALVSQRVSKETGVLVSRRLALNPNDEVYVACGADFHYKESYHNVDLSSMPYPSADGCMILCLTTIDRCDAVTWTNYNGGTCWFKANGGSFGWFGSVPDSGAISFFTNNKGYNGLTHRTFVNMDMNGYDLSSSSAGFAYDSSYCTGVCHWMQGCFASTWTDYNGGTCWFKTKGSQLIPRQGAVSSLQFYIATVGMCKQ